jgi:hypothetical protein
VGLSPDSVKVSSTNVFVRYSNEGEMDGSGRTVSSIVEYDFRENALEERATGDSEETTGETSKLTRNARLRLLLW